jgi:hypothetical protein
MEADTVQVMKNCPPKSRAERVQAREGAAIKKSRQLDCEAITRGAVPIGTTPALRATPPDSGGVLAAFVRSFSVRFYLQNLQILFRSTLPVCWSINV